MPSAAFEVEGLEELNIALKHVDKGTAKAFRDGFREVAEPVRDSSERLALSEIRNMGPAWSRMRVGVSTKEVYVAPASRRKRGSPRPNLGGLLMRRAMLPALKKHEAELVDEVEKAMGNLIGRAGL